MAINRRVRARVYEREMFSPAGGLPESTGECAVTDIPLEKSCRNSTRHQSDKSSHITNTKMHYTVPLQCTSTLSHCTKIKKVDRHMHPSPSHHYAPVSMTTRVQITGEIGVNLIELEKACGIVI